MVKRFELTVLQGKGPQVTQGRAREGGLLDVVDGRVLRRVQRLDDELDGGLFLLDEREAALWVPLERAAQVAHLAQRLLQALPQHPGGVLSAFGGAVVIVQSEIEGEMAVHDEDDGVEERQLESLLLRVALPARGVDLVHGFLWH